MAKLTVGPCTEPADVEAFAALLTQSLFFPELREARWPEREGSANFRVIREGRTILGGAAIQRMGQWFGGRPVPMGGYRAVAVDPARRSSGVAGKLLSATLRELRQDHVPLAALYPSTQPVYRRAGFEQAGTRTIVRLPLSGLRGAKGPALVRLSTEDRAPFLHAYEARARRTNGHLDRNDWAWWRILEPWPVRAPVHAYRLGSHASDGHVVFTQLQNPRTLRGELIVREWAIGSAAGAARFLALLADHRSVFDAVLLPVAPNEPFLLAVENQEHTVESQQHWLLRLVHLPAAIAARGWPADIAGALHLEVTDELLPENAGRWILEVVGGEARLRRGGRGRLRITARGLGPLYSGYLTPQELAAAGLLAGPDQELSRAALLFAGPAPWMPDKF